MAKVLVVDDESGIRDLLQEVLSDLNYETAVAGSAQAARVALQEFAPDIVLLDAWMPETNGLALLEEWQSTKQIRMPIIMMSGDLDKSWQEKAKASGAYRFLEKPVTMNALIKSLGEALEALKLKKYSGFRQTVSYCPPYSRLVRTNEHGAISPTPALFESMFNTTAKNARLQFERHYLAYHLRRHQGSMEAMVKATGVGRTYLCRMIRHHRLMVLRSRQRNLVES